MKSDLDNNTNELEASLGDDDIVEDAEAELEVMDQDRQAAAKEERRTLARKENKAVFCLRIVVFAALFVAAVIVSGGVYVFTKNDEIDDFESEVESSAHMLRTSFNDALERRVGAMNSLSTKVTPYALEGNHTFPFVTVPNFAQLGADFRIQADSFIVHYCPIIEDETRSAWEEYAMENRGQIDEAYEADLEMRQQQDADFGIGQRKMQEKDQALPDPNVVQDGSNYNKGIWSNGAIMPPGLVPEGNASLGVMPFLLQKKAVLAKTIVPIPSMHKQVATTLQAGQYRHDFESYLAEPMTFFFYPVLTSFDRETQEVGGVIVVNLYWRLLFDNILAENAIGYVCVLTNSYNQTVSYRVDGATSVFLGNGDHHDPRFDHLEVSANMNENMAKRAAPETRSYLTVPVEQEFGVYTLKVYPSQDTEDTFLSQKPLHYTIVVVTVFAATSLVFIAFTSSVEYRQKLVMRRAVESGAIVSSLFPETVKERLYNTDIAASNKNKNNAWNADDDNVEGIQGVERADKSAPIADLFPECTVLFADLCGFTAWAVKRNPTEVFTLLETLYGSFDAAAERRNVFKVETIGDCYVAATGLPRPQEDHAVIMAMFARDCLGSTTRLLHGKLMNRLGGDTAKLTIRIGLYSGPVTGGVLRGKKARFQLFGDTVNTASRTESTGMGGRIHISDATAEELKSKGKGSWLERRPDVVTAKGKGEMQTYWLKCEPRIGTSTTHSIALDSSPSSTDANQTVEDIQDIRARLSARYNSPKMGNKKLESTGKI